ncbi:hypothetical protein, partial [Stieleria sp.]|uniref:hypothetical protein n=1 Tax=Stieleria sp. TaxID=2795976 RepID=UPI00356292A3
AGDPILQNIHTEDNIGVPFYFELDTDPQTTGLSGRGNLGGDRIVIQGGTLTEDRTWDYGDLPIHLTGSNFVVGADAQSNPVMLTIAAGTVIKMSNGQYFESRPGTINAVGTAEDPIVFTASTDDTVGGDSNGDRSSSKPFPGFWESLYQYGPSNVLEHVQVRYAGDTDGNGAFSGQVGSIELYHAGTAAETQNRLTNVTVSHGYSNGINVRAAKPALENVHVFKNVGAAYYFELDAAPQVTNLTGQDNLGGDRIAIQAGTLTESRIWDYGDLPIHIISGNLVLGSDAESNPANLDIAAGTVIKIDQANYLWARDGALRALGTPTDPIYFTAASDDTVGGDVTGDGDASSPYPGFWESIYIDGAGSVLSNVVVRYAGDTDGNGIFAGERQAIEVSADMTLTNVNVESSYGGGLRIEGGANVTYTGGRLDSTAASTNTARSAIVVVDGTLTATDLDLIANDGPGDLGVYVLNGQSASVSNSNFIGNTIAVRHDGTDPGKAFFQNNWWASSGGPHDPSALDGIVNDNPAGQPVTDYVDYSNFLTSPANRAIGPRVVAMEKLAP